MAMALGGGFWRRPNTFLDWPAINCSGIRQNSSFFTVGILANPTTSKSRRVGQTASFSAANADPPSAANKLERRVIKNHVAMVGHKLAEARFRPPYKNYQTRRKRALQPSYLGPVISGGKICYHLSCHETSISHRRARNAV